MNHQSCFCVLRLRSISQWAAALSHAPVITVATISLVFQLYNVTKRFHDTGHLKYGLNVLSSTKECERFRSSLGWKTVLYPRSCRSGWQAVWVYATMSKDSFTLQFSAVAAESRTVVNFCRDDRSLLPRVLLMIHSSTPWSKTRPRKL